MFYIFEHLIDMDDSMARGLVTFFSIVIITILTLTVILCCCYAYYQCCNCRKGERQDGGMTIEMSTPKSVGESRINGSIIPSDEPTAI